VCATAALCLALTATGVARGGPPVAADAPNADIQAQLRLVVEAIVGTTGDAEARLDRLAEVAPSRVDLLMEIAVFLRDAHGTEEAMGGALVLDQLAFGDAEKVAAIVPHLDTPDPALRRVLYDLLGTVDRGSGGEPEFGAYLTLLGGDSPPSELVRYLYATSPRAALDAMRRAHPETNLAAEDRDIDAVDAVLRGRARGERLPAAAMREPAASLERLSRSPVWWLRLYAAAALRDEPVLANPEIKARLESDAHALVRAAARD